MIDGLYTPGTAASGELSEIYTLPSYLFRQKMLKIFGGRIDVYAPNGTQVMCCLQKAFKLKEDIRLYTDDTKRKELITIQARNIIDFSAAYDVVDAASGQRLGTLRRKGWQSMIRDAWEILDVNERPIAKIEEDNMILALVRRFLTDLVPQSFHFVANDGREIAKAHQNFNPFVHKINLVMPQGALANLLDPRMILAATTLLVLIENRQQ